MCAVGQLRFNKLVPLSETKRDAKNSIPFGRRVFLFSAPPFGRAICLQGALSEYALHIRSGNERLNVPVTDCRRCNRYKFRIINVYTPRTMEEQSERWDAHTAAATDGQKGRGDLLLLGLLSKRDANEW